MYPSFFYQNGDIVPTGAIDFSLQGTWRNNDKEICVPEKNEDCFYYPNEEQLDEITCSLGGLHFLPNVTKFCSLNDTKVMGPTKHNILCQGKSTSDIIKDHSDFYDLKKNNATNIDNTLENIGKLW